MNEAETRAELIDPALNAAGWGVVEGSYIKGGTWGARYYQHNAIQAGLEAIVRKS